MGEPARIVHPGPVAAERTWTARARARPESVTLAGGVPLIEALEAGCGEPAWVELSGTLARRLAFVRPAPAPGDGHAAWYSERTVLEGARILRAGLHLGREGAAPFAHVHGIWAEADGAVHMGHLLTEETILDRDAEAEALLLDGAAMVRAEDPETRFSLFRPKAAGASGGDAVLAVVRPNEDLHSALAAIARAAGLERARVRGLGSLVGAVFEAGPEIGSYATEVLLTEGRVSDGEVELSAAAVGFDGARSEGRLARGRAVVCVTFEVLLSAA